MNYDKDNQKKFNEFLKSKNISFSQKGSNFLLKNRLMRYQKKPIYDLEFDQQLLSGIKIINETKYK